MKQLQRNKRGFTITELVIVIAVIAILAAVLIPTFSNVIEKANLSSAMQSARNEYESYLSYYAEYSENADNYIIVSGDYAFVVEDNEFNADGTKIDEDDKEVKIENGTSEVTFTVKTGEEAPSSKGGGLLRKRKRMRKPNIRP